MSQPQSLPLGEQRKKSPCRTGVCWHACFPLPTLGEGWCNRSSHPQSPLKVRASKRMLSVLEEARGASRFIQENKQKDFHPSMLERAKANSKHAKLVFKVVWEGVEKEGNAVFLDYSVWVPKCAESLHACSSSAGLLIERQLSRCILL